MNELQKATFGGGCFWCVEAVIQRLRGVESVVSGYAGGHDTNPTYEAVCNGVTGHAEVVQVTFDSAVISYADLLSVFMTSHDPTTVNRQGADQGTQYRSIILPHNAEQRAIAEQVLQKLSPEFRDSIVTEVKDLDTFYPAESYHQDYYNQHRNQGYCQVVIDPKIMKLRKQYADRLRLETA
ncbi:MAG TPA: peptide-methionine (S)-S-oxide reductase [Cytophagales bacterium]|nr:peptide-methionine (S)-S-oxide reductase [Cytophagales bacterium]HAA20709.1 peptide-methionine (S)-S-oxide reductase [Cytophagales bacterium]HAP63754.1 peptide-methionine (S)-S-oxide reductase [Cytophagales bacterium]